MDSVVSKRRHAKDTGAVFDWEGRRGRVLNVWGGRRRGEVVDAQVLVKQGKEVRIIEELEARLLRVWGYFLHKQDESSTEKSREMRAQTSSTSPVFQFHTRIWPGFVLADHATRSPKISVVDRTLEV